ncbi:hypothetical protein TNCT_665871 [Trichonephila clavata]|uniref:Uncharacterized protein n=1 Tax=Trichonephila clavata TaxID=2740835 RepID=A0A8X6KF77_TRICU|nr:hypothetical protein TNCT_665841 [Trichonephila clavata]GFQ70131.1 hypothetical protein TNCT_665871 [Trichonephila clavata]
MAATGQSQGQSPAVPLVESKPGTSSMRGLSLRTKPNAIQAGIHAHNWKQEQEFSPGSKAVKKAYSDQRQHWNRQQDQQDLDGDFSPQVSRGNWTGQQGSNWIPGSGTGVGRIRQVVLHPSDSQPGQDNPLITSWSGFSSRYNSRTCGERQQ